MAPPKKPVYGVGINDITTPVRIKKQDGTYQMCEVYCRWANMLRRCYINPRVGSRYEACEVSEPWMLLSEYSKWYKSKYIKGFVVDKDLLSGSLYSPDTCLFIPEKINSFISEGLYLSKLPSGVHYNKEKGKFCSRTYNPFSPIRGKYTHCGYTDTAEEATYNYMVLKNIYANELAVTLENRVAKEALSCRYQVGHWFYEDRMERAREADREWVL